MSKRQEKARKELARERKRLEGRPFQAALGNPHPKKRMQAARQSLAHVHFSIEATIWRFYEQNPSLDDRAVDDAMRSFFERVVPSDIETADMIDTLLVLRDQMEQLSNDQWLGCLESLRESIRARSSRAPGERKYLEFLCHFIGSGFSGG